jgi:ribonucleoside-triphosphate reductase
MKAKKVCDILEEQCHQLLKHYGFPNDPLKYSCKDAGRDFGPFCPVREVCKPRFTEIRKRDGRIVPFDPERIAVAIHKASVAVGTGDLYMARRLTIKVLRELPDGVPEVEQIQDMVEKILMENGYSAIAKAYILYRARRTRMRESKSELMDTVKEILVETSKENANISNSPSAKMLLIGSAASKKYYLTNVLPEEFSQAHVNGDIHIHDLDYYSKTLNCLQIDLTRLLREGFNTGYGYIRPPKRIASAAAQAAIILQSNQNDMYGGQSFPHFDYSMGALLGSSLRAALDDDVFQAMEAFIYNLNSMHSRAGAQVVFSSLNLGTDTSEHGRLVTRSVLQVFYNGLGRGESAVFPNIIFRVKKGVNLNPGDPNYDLFRFALKVAARRLSPTFSFMDSSFNKPYGEEVSYMGCRTRVIGNRHGAEVSAGRGNIAFVTVNLPRLALVSRGPVDFYNRLTAVLDLAARQLLHRYEVLARLKVKDLPFLMGQSLYMGADELGPDDEIGPAIKHGTLSIGFIGLAEALCALCGKHHGESPEAQELGLNIVKFMRDRVDNYADGYDLNYTLLATPAEGLSGRFIGLDRKLFGAIEGVTDKDYYTNSFHVPVGCDMAYLRKIEVEGPYHKYCNAGHITYVELDSAPIHNVDAVEKIVRAMAENDVGYGGINFPLDECICGFSGLIPEACPSCGNVNIRRIRRITGYLSTVDRFNSAKRAELRDRRPHL